VLSAVKSAAVTVVQNSTATDSRAPLSGGPLHRKTG
jgi:hypothetical protein